VSATGLVVSETVIEVSVDATEAGSLIVWTTHGHPSHIFWSAQDWCKSPIKSTKKREPPGTLTNCVGYLGYYSDRHWRRQWILDYLINYLDDKIISIVWIVD